MRESIAFLIIGLITLLFQLGLARHISMPAYAIPMPYVIYWLYLPLRWNPYWSLAAAAVFGILLDILFPPYGLQSYCGLWVWGLRRVWLRSLHPTLPEEAESTFLQRFSSADFFAYAFPLTLWHHLWYIPLVEWSLGFHTLLRIGLSSLYSFFWEWVIFELLLHRSHG